MPAAYARFIEALDANHFKYKADGRGRARAQCPGHNGDDLNLAVAVGDQGVLLRCHAYDCPAEDIARALGMRLGDLFDQDGKATYDYGMGHHVERFRTRDGKKIIQHNHPGSVTHLYRHPDSRAIEDSDVVTLVEGEKSVDAAIRLGIECATTWPGGASAVDHVDIDPLSGKRVRIIADNDEPGRAAAAHMIQRLAGLATVEAVLTAPKEKQGVDDVWLDGGELGDLVPLDVSAYVSQPKIEERTRDGHLDYLSDHRSRPVRWLWEGLIPSGSAVVFAGMGGVSKSTFAIWLAGRLTRGLVKGCFLGEPTTVLYVSHEDGIDDVVLPRAQVNNVDTTRFATFGTKMKTLNGVMMPTFPEDLQLLEEAIIRAGAKVVIIDPMVSTMEKGADPNDLVAVRRLVNPLNELAQRLGISIIGVAHTNKGATNARTAVTGSGAWVDATRGTLMFAMQPAEPDLDYTDVVIGKAKQNYSKGGTNYGYRVQSVVHMHDNGENGEVPKIQWLGESAISVEDVMSMGNEDRRVGFLSGAIKEFIDGSPGAVSTRQVIDEFKDQPAVNVRMTLTRLTKSGKVHSPERGYYQGMRFAPHR